MASDTASLYRQDSQETLVSLAQLDPSPMDIDKDLPPLPGETMESSTSSLGTPMRTSTASLLGLGGSGRGPIFYCSYLADRT